MFDRMVRLAGPKGVWIGLFVGFVLACPVAAQDAAQDNPADTRQIGFALHMDGAWLSNGQPIAGNGASLDASAVISLSPATDFRSGHDLALTVVALPPAPTRNDRTASKKMRPFPVTDR
jgi:hypothetical protein